MATLMREPAAEAARIALRFAALDKGGRNSIKITQ